MNIGKPFWDWWGLKNNPFGAIGGADDVFESREIGRIIDRLVEAVEEGGIHAVTGERGIGKTTAKNEILNYMDEHRERYAYSIVECMDMQQVKMGTIHSAIVMDLSNEPPKGQTEQRSRQVTRIIGELAAQKKVVLIIDEAQRLSIETLEKLKMLTERRWAFRSRLISVILFGQSELNYKLSRDDGLNMRVTRLRMSGLTTDEVLQYIDLRVRTAAASAASTSSASERSVAGAVTMRDIFDEGVLVYLAENQHSPLHINHICASAMRIARQVGEKRVTIAMIYETRGVRTPRQILKDNNITLRQFSKMIHIDEGKLVKLLDNDFSKTNGSQQKRFHDGLNEVMRGDGGAEQERIASAG